MAKALELACSLGFPKILLNMDMATLATETQNACEAKQRHSQANSRNSSSSNCKHNPKITGVEKESLSTGGAPCYAQRVPDPSRDCRLTDRDDLRQRNGGSRPTLSLVAGRTDLEAVDLAEARTLTGFVAGGGGG